MTEGENMVERCARAVCCPDGCIGSVGVIPCNIAGEDRMAMRQARAVIEALMEPTPEMLWRGEGIVDFVLPEGFDNSWEGRRRELKTAWQEMLRTALSQPNEEGEGK